MTYDEWQIIAFTAGAAITFAAGARATIALDGTHTYSLNLANGTVSRQ